MTRNNSFEKLSEEAALISALPKNILVADDNTDRSLHLALLLKRLEYNVFVAPMGLDILRIANGIMPNLILLDVNMSPIEGQNCLEKLRSTKMYSIIKIVMVGDRSEKANLEKSVKKGAEAYITRPISATELYRTVHNLVELHPRQIPRLRIIFKATIFVGNTGRSSFATRLSEQGAFIRSLNPLPVNTKIKLALDLPSEKPLTLDGEVIYVVKPGQEKYIEPGMGIRFLNLDREIQLGLRKFIEDQLTGEFDSEMLI